MSSGTVTNNEALFASPTIAGIVNPVSVCSASSIVAQSATSPENSNVMLVSGELLIVNVSVTE